MPKKLYDLAVKTGTKSDGKGRYKNIGVVIDGGEKGPYLLLDRTFNPAGVNVEAGRDSLIVSCFKPREDQQQLGGFGGTPAPAENDQDIPF